MSGSLLPQPKQVFLDNAANPLVGGLIYTYAAGTLTKKATYQDYALTTPNQNPIVCNARGEATAYGAGMYRVILKDANGGLVYDRDNVECIASVLDFINVDVEDVDAARAAAITAMSDDADAVADYRVAAQESIDASAAVAIAGIGYEPPAAYAAGIALTSGTQTVSYNGDTYAPKFAELPFTTSGVFETAKFRLIQGVSAADLAASSGASLVGGGAQVVSSIAALRALVKSSPSSKAIVTGYYADGDGGGGAYYLDAADTASADNGGTVIVATDGGRWKLAHFGVISVKQFGAKGDFDGVSGTDDQAAIQATINDTASIGAKCYIPDAWYSGAGGLDAPSNSWIEWGPNAWYYPTAHSNGGAIISNVSVLPKARENITLINPQVNGALLPFTGAGNDDNGIGFATGVSGVRVLGGHIKGFLANMASGPGGKGVGFEEGVEDVIVDGLKVEDCTYATFISPTLDDPAKYVRNIQFTNMHIKRCAAIAWALADAGAATVPTADPSMCSAMWSNIAAEDVGHFPDRANPAGRFEKSGAFLLHGVSNITGRNIKIFNNSGYPSVSHPAGGTLYPTGYPASGTGLTGSGLSGGIGAVVWGWGRNIDLEIEFNGEADDIVNVSFPRAHSALSFAGGIAPVGCSSFGPKITKRGTHAYALRSGYVGGHTGTMQAGGTSSVTLSAAASNRDGEYAGQNITTTGGTGSGQTRRILTYNGATKVAAVDAAFSPATDATTTYSISGSTSAVADGQISGQVEFICDTPTLGIVDASARFPAGAQVKATSPAGVAVSGSWFNAYSASNSFADGSTNAGGTWTPTLFNTLNVDASTAYSCHYIRSGNIVFFGGNVSIDPTAAGATQLDMSLPVPCNLTASTQVGGVFSDSARESGQVIAETTNDRIRLSFTTVSTTNRTFGFSGSYRVL